MEREEFSRCECSKCFMELEKENKKLTKEANDLYAKRDEYEAEIRILKRRLFYWTKNEKYKVDDWDDKEYYSGEEVID